MPFDTANPLDRSKADEFGILEHRPVEPSFSAVAGAAWRQDNIIGSYLASPRREVDDFMRVDPNYNPYNDLKGYEQYADRFEEVFNPEAAFAVKAGIDQENKDREILAAAGWVGVGASIGATLVDPTILLPGGALVKAGRLGYRALRSGASVGLASGVATAVQEAGLQATQELRTARTVHDCNRRLGAAGRAVGSRCGQSVQFRGLASGKSRTGPRARTGLRCRDG